MITDTNKLFFRISALCLIVLTTVVTSCKKSRSDMGKNLYLKTKNKVFKDVTPEGFSEVFKQVLVEEKSNLAYPQLIQDFYDQNGYDPVFVMDHIFNGDDKAAADYYEKAGAHGLNPALFNGAKIDTLVNKFYRKKGIKTLSEAYHDMAELELQSANSLMLYTNAMEYGVVNPKRIYSRYFTETRHPDSASMSAVFQVKNLKTYLDSIQPKNPQYVALQKALAANYQAPGLSAEQTRRTIVVNLERLRWKNKPTQNRYVLVNIPAYSLDVMDSGKSVLNMKVCVGEGRNKDFTYDLTNFPDSCKTDKPGPHETPQLNSLIYCVDVNPIWNIPQSIVAKEIARLAGEDPFYLSNKGINVYHNGKEIDPDNINWADVARNADDYEFKQKPGDANSLGKIKFLFPNKSSVYLHDTPVKSAFNKEYRDVSHGCVRLGDPQGLALALFGQGPKYDLIVKDMAADKPDPTTINLPKKTPVYITYVTSWADSTGTVQFAKDVYGLDAVLYTALNSVK